MKKILKSISLTLILALSITLIDHKIAYADYYLKAEPSTVITNSKTTKVVLPTLPVDCYVLYTSRESDEPLQSQMWRIPGGTSNVQDFNINGTWYLHVYIPSTGQRKTFGPYSKEVQPPDVPQFQCNTLGIVPGKWTTNTYASFEVATRGDSGSSGHDNINNTDSLFTSGFKYMEVWDNNTKLGDIGSSWTNFTITDQGWHKLWAKAVDRVGNESQWAIYEFGLGPETEKPSDGDNTGKIKFNPNETSWTNKGKTGEGKGSYPVDVSFTGSNPYKDKGTATIKKTHSHTHTDSDGHSHTSYTYTYHDKSFTVNFPFKSIYVSGDASKTINGTSGTVNIEKEGEGLSLKGKGSWESAEYSLPGGNVVSYSLPSKPSDPTGQSGKYNIDWTKPEIKVTEPRREWHKDDPYNINVKIHDELSGIDNGTITIDDSSHYNRDNSIAVSGGSKDFSKTIGLDDGIYSVRVETTDVATNKNDETFQTYYVDNTDPEIDFNIKDQIFSETNNAIRKDSKFGCDDSFYGKLKVTDNLSGVKSIAYKWTYGDEKPSSGYRTIYTHGDTYYDRHNEVEENEIEKPVGDNLYLHVEVYDVTGNYTYKCFGPYEDPIKLLNFQVTDIRDPRWTNVFWEDDLFEKYKNVTYKVNQLPIDESSHPTIRNSYPKKGYAFYFDIQSEYLYREADRIEITPTFYYINIFNKKIPLDLYYNNENNPLIMYGSNDDNLKLNLDTVKYGSVWIGGLSKLTLTKGVRIVKGREWTNGWKNEIQYRDGKIQWWYGKYLIPATSVFVKQGDIPRPENIIHSNNIIVNFQIIAYKNGVETLSSDQIFTYVSNQWNFEGGPKNSNYKSGDVMVYDNKYSALSDYTAHVIQ